MTVAFNDGNYRVTIHMENGLTINRVNVRGKTLNNFIDLFKTTQDEGFILLNDALMRVKNINAIEFIELEEEEF